MLLLSVRQQRPELSIPFSARPSAPLPRLTTDHSFLLLQDELVSQLRRRSKSFSRGSSRFRGVTLHKGGRWEARMGRYLGKKCERTDRRRLLCRLAFSLTVNTGTTQPSSD